MFSLSTEYGNKLDVADCVLNSLEIEAPFISFYNDRIGYYVSYYFRNKGLCVEYMGDDKNIDDLFYIYWKGKNNAEEQIADELAYQEPIFQWWDMPEEYFTKAIEVILKAMDGFSQAASMVA